MNGSVAMVFLSRQIGSNCGIVGSVQSTEWVIMMIESSEILLHIEWVALGCCSELAGSLHPCQPVMTPDVW
jgi:hypothetical protein